MKKYLLLFLLLPCFAVAQKTKPASKPADQKTDGFTITGTVSGYPDGTIVDLLNGNNGSPEAASVVKNGMFSFQGKSPVPDFKLIAFNKQPPYITLFIGNSQVKVNAKKDFLEMAEVTGSASNAEFQAFNKMIQPYMPLFAPDAVNDAAKVADAVKMLESYIDQNPGAHITPLAIFRHHQLSENDAKMEELFNTLSPEVQGGPIGNYIAQQIAETKKNPIGQVLPDFVQEDTSGVALRLSSFQGKYVLVDFWASWCGPCRVENPNVVSAYHKFKNKNFTILGVSLDKSKQPWIDAIHKDNLTWFHVSDLKGWQNAVAQQYQIYSIPQNFLLDPSGKVIAKNLRGAALEQKLSDLLK